MGAKYLDKKSCGYGSKIPGTQKTYWYINGKINQNLWSPRVSFLTHSLLEQESTTAVWKLRSFREHPNQGILLPSTTWYWPIETLLLFSTSFLLRLNPLIHSVCKQPKAHIRIRFEIRDPFKMQTRGKRYKWSSGSFSFWELPPYNFCLFQRPKLGVH